MTAFLLGGILTLAPSILSTVVQCTKGVNPGNDKSSSIEKKVAEGQYEHLEKKLIKLNAFLRERADIPKMEFSGNDDDGYKLDCAYFPKIHMASELLAKSYESFLDEKVLPVVYSGFFAGSFDTESEMYSVISKIPELAYLDVNMLNASSLEHALSNYSLHIPNYHIGTDPALSTMLTKLIDDSILAFSRVAPNRIICPTEYFCTFPYKEDDWFLGFHYAKSVEHIIAGTHVKLEIIFNDQLNSIMSTYRNVYDFEVQVWWDAHTEDNTWSTHNDHEYFGGKILKITGNSIKAEFDVEPKYSNAQIKYSYKYYARLKSGNILARDVAGLHNLTEREFTFGSLISKGNYKLNDPIFGIRAIYNNTISSSQFSIQTSFALLAAWIITIQMTNPDKGTKIKTRYSSIFQGFELEDLCAIDQRILKTKKLHDKPIQGLSSLWDRVINDMNFMKKYILRTKSGRNLVSNVVLIC